MNTVGWSAEQKDGLKKVRASLGVGLGFLALEGALAVADTTDTISVPWVVHAYVGVLGVGLVGSNALYLRELHANPPESLGDTELV
jgi:hypothetical protein